MVNSPSFLRQCRRRRGKGPDADAPAAAQGYGSVADVLLRLEALGLRVSPSKLYGDIQLGTLPRQSNGRFLEADVEDYADGLRSLPGDRGQVDAVLEGITREKLQAEIARIKGQCRRQDLENKRREASLVASARFYPALLVRVSVFSHYLRAAFRARAADYLKMAPEDAIDAYCEDVAQTLSDVVNMPGWILKTKGETIDNWTIRPIEDDNQQEHQKKPIVLAKEIQNDRRNENARNSR